MAPEMQRKLALFAGLLLVLAGLITAVPDTWLLGPEAACHGCHDLQYPADHLLYRTNYMGYDSLCSFAPFSTLVLIGTGIAIFLTTFRIKLERWGSQYRLIAGIVLTALAVITVLPVQTGYRDLLGYSTLDPLVPLSTIALLALAVAALAGYIVCPFLIIMRCRCPVLEYEMDATFAPDRAILRYLGIALAGKLDDEAVRRLYRCTLCDGCWLAWFNRNTRTMAVAKGLMPAHVVALAESVERYGNAYGVADMANGPDQGGIKANTILFRGCTARLRAPEILAAARELLDKKGIVYGIMDGEACCGYTLYNLGDAAAGGRAVERNIRAFAAAGVKRIITICPGCHAALNTYYKGRDGFDAEIVLALDLLEGLCVPARGVTVHDPCHAKEKSETVHGMLRGARDDGTGACCGAGGGVMSFDRMLAGARAARVLEEAPDLVVTYCPFCYLNLSRADAKRVVDLHVLLARGGLES